MEAVLMTTTHVLKHPVLSTARAAGKVTRVGQDGALAVVRVLQRLTLQLPVHAAVRTNELVMASVKFLNPFRWVKKSAGGRSWGNCKQGRTASLAVPKPRGTGFQPVKSQAGSRRRTDPGVPARGATARPRTTRRTTRAAKNIFATPQDVTPAEVTAAVFAGVTEKVMFTRALKDLDSQNQATRARAARILAGIPHDLSARALSARLGRDPSAEVRKQCVNGLTALGMKKHLPAVEYALSDGCSSVRLAAVRGIHRLAGADGAASLIGMFADIDEDVRRRAAACLGWLGQKHLAGKLLPLLRGESVSVRLTALEALGNLRSPAVVGEVIELLDDAEGSVQRKAFQVLQTITGKQMGETFPEDEEGRRFLIARWRAWQEKKPLRQRS